MFFHSDETVDHVEEVFGAFTIFGLVILGGFGALGVGGVVTLGTFGKHCFQVNIQPVDTFRHWSESWFRRFSNIPENTKPEKNPAH